MRLISQSEFARLCGVSLSTINAAVNYGPLQSAMQGRLLDYDNPLVAEYLERRAMAMATGADSASRASPSKVHRETKEALYNQDDLNERHKAKLAELANDIRALADMSLTDLIFYFGEDVRFLDWLKALREIENIEQKRTKNAKDRNDLVRRDVVHNGFFVVLDTLFRQVLQDAAKNIATRAAAMVKADRGTEEITEYVRSVLATYFSTAKKNMSEALENGID